jgi:hypothetical protein
MPRGGCHLVSEDGAFILQLTDRINNVIVPLFEIAGTPGSIRHTLQERLRDLEMAGRGHPFTYIIVRTDVSDYCVLGMVVTQAPLDITGHPEAVASPLINCLLGGSS